MVRQAMSLKWPANRAKARLVFQLTLFRFVSPNRLSQLLFGGKIALKKAKETCQRRW